MPKAAIQNRFKTSGCSDAWKSRERNMAKRTPPRSQGNEASPANENSVTRAQPKARRSRAAAPPEDTIGGYPGVERSEDDGTIARAVASDQSSASRSMGSEPSDDDIRARAYQRYLERGGNHGQDFEDWLAAERELKRSKI
jgi:hypothetical protein